MAPIFSSAKAKEITSNGNEKLRPLRALLQAKVMGQDEAVECALITLVAGGHLLLEGPPGIGKTSLAHGLASLFHGSFRRLQMTSDLLPSDIVGTLRLRPGSADFDFRPGPIFCNVLLADELNRTSAKTQAALLEAMSEQKVTVDGVSHELPNPFFVVATQNPQEFHGVYPLSESQLDRFMMHVMLTLPDTASEISLYRQHANQVGKGSSPVEALFTPADLLGLRVDAAKVFVEDSVLAYVHEIARELRKVEDMVHAASVRAILQLIDAAKARAFVNGRAFVLPEDVHSLAPGVLAHRLCFRAGEFSSLQRKDIVRHALTRVDTPK